MNGLLTFCADLLLLTGGFIVLCFIVMMIGFIAIELSDQRRERAEDSEKEV